MACLSIINYTLIITEKIRMSLRGKTARKIKKTVLTERYKLAVMTISRVRHGDKGK